MSHKFNATYNQFSSFRSFVFVVFFFSFLFLREGIDGGDKWLANLLKEEQLRKTCGNMGTKGNFARGQGNKDPLGDPHGWLN